LSKIYNIYLSELHIGSTELEKADAPMGVVIGELKFTDQKIGYDFLKEYCTKNQIELASDYPDDKMISTMTIPKLKVINDDKIEIKGVGNQITGMDNQEYEISIFGVPYPFYEVEFPHHVKAYEKMLGKK